ncbi:resA protein [Sorangium cellulosum]|uniref:ResA protein n=1 Tax=Sorangium cellulosum TaxID=56 RepID=A0A4P2Q9H2_SORCE|nr:TlpA disulfide reductase family protein [Sorangium cellulosum]AUX25891.1 resA protein [Sorangium cellulosum]
MTRTIRCALSLVLTVLSLAATSCGAAPGARASSPAPDFSLPALDGRTVRLSDYAGKNVVLIDFWSTTCDPCLAEMPHLVELYKKHKDRGFVVLAVSLDGPESRAQVSSTVHDREMIFPVLLDEETTVAARYNPKRELPFSVLIGKDGSILHKRGGYQPGDEVVLAQEIERALNE